MSPIRRATARTFASLRIRNYRLYFFGQCVSVTGTWMQWVAQSWLVLEMTGSGTALGIVTAMQFAPAILGGVWGGVAADRFDKRRILIVTQALAATLAVALAVLVWTGAVRLWMVAVLALLLGCVTMMDHPSRHAFVTEMVGPEGVANAVALNSAAFNGARIVGPAIAAALIASTGLAWAFLLNGLSYVAVIVALLLMDRSALMPARPAPRAKAQGREALRFVWRSTELRRALSMLAVITTFGMNFTVVLPLLASRTFHGDAHTYGILMSFMAAGALAGALSAAWRNRPGARVLGLTSGAFGLFAVLAALAPAMPVAAMLLVPTGAASIVFIANANSMVQLRAPEGMRGRVMALYSQVLLGGTTVGAPIIGWVCQQWGARSGLALGGVLALASGTAMLVRLRPARREAEAAVAR